MLDSNDRKILAALQIVELARHEQFLIGTLLKLPGVRDIGSNFAIRTVKQQAALPLKHLK